MHRIFFSIKRVHLRVVEVSKRLVGAFELTPARFDMLRVVMLHAPYGATQWRLRALLGVSAATVSRMAKSLEMLGFVARARSGRDARDVWVTLTELGKERVTAAMKALVDSGVADTFAKRGVDFDPQAATVRLSVLQTALSSMRRIYGDAALFIDPWRRGGLVPYLVRTFDGTLRQGTGDRALDAVVLPESVG